MNFKVVCSFAILLDFNLRCLELAHFNPQLFFQRPDLFIKEGHLATAALFVNQALTTLSLQLLDL